MKPKLKFSNNYIKLPINWEGLFAKLISIDCIRLEALPKEFKEWDTCCIGIGNCGHYPLPKKGYYLLLWFFIIDPSKKGIFCTLRRYTTEKYRYYQDNLYKEFELVRSEK